VQNTDAQQMMAARGDLLVSSRQYDDRTVEHAQHVVVQTGNRLDSVLIQLGLLTERGLVATYAALFQLPIAGAARYPMDAPLLSEHLPPRFLPNRAPVALEGEALILAAADPLDQFTPAAIAAATGRSIKLEIAVPVELEAALDRPYPVEAEAGDVQSEAVAPVPLEDNTERLKDLASEAHGDQAGTITTRSLEREPAVGL